jgi:hypothetical protein
MDIITMAYEVLLRPVDIPRIPTKRVGLAFPVVEGRGRLTFLVMVIHSGLAGLPLIKLSTIDKTSV